MHDLDRREAFLLAIFAAPDDDLPRLVFADYLDETGDGEWADRIRRGCHARTPGRGFDLDPQIRIPADLLADPAEFRRTALFDNPHWYGCVGLKVTGGLIASSKPVNTLLTSPVTQRVTNLDLSGGRIEMQREASPVEDTYGFLSEYEHRPAVTLQAVEALVSARECRRFTHLDLRDNDLDNDAARAIIRSNNLIRLKSLHVFDGNQLRGRTWAQLQDKFGEDVVS